MVLLNEVLFMESRLFSLFCERTKTEPRKADYLFTKFGIWKYIEDCYDTIHTDCDESIYQDIISILKKQEARI